MCAYLPFLPCDTQVLVPKDPQLLGKMFEVIITSTGKHYLKGDVVTESLVRVPLRPSPLPIGAVSGGEKWRQHFSESVIDSSPVEEDNILKRVSQLVMRSGDIILLVSAVVIICTAIAIHYGPYLKLFYQ